MHDIKFIRENPKAFDAAMARRGFEGLSEGILALDSDRRASQTKLQELQSRRNDLSKKIGDVKRTGGDADAIMSEVAGIKDEMAALEETERTLGEQLTTKLASIPNILADDVPPGKDDTESREERRVGTLPQIANPKEHFDLGEALGLMDIPVAGKMSGARFTLLRGSLARMERALGEFMLNLLTNEYGYTEISPPLMVRDEAVFGTGQLPKFEEDLFRTTTGHWLIPTAEVPLTNTVSGEILAKEKLPLRVTARTPCFRSEAGSAGKDTRGMLRQHQFYKVEMVSITAPEQSVEEHERMVGCAEEVLKRLGLPYRVVTLCTGDTGFCSRKTYDIEVWLPGQNTYREISSCSNCWDFQARRMNTRCRKTGDKATEFVHTLNGSGVAIGRALIAVMENYQQPDGSIVVPDVLRPLMGGLEKIEKV